MDAEIKYIKLSNLTKKIENAINNSIGSEFYWIIAEISGHKFYPNNDRHYFEFIEKHENIIEPVAKVRGVSWYSGSQNIKLFESFTNQKFTNGIQVLVKVKIEYHASYGLSLVLLDIDQSFTLGNIEKQRKETLNRLINENPGFVKKIGDEFITLKKTIELNKIVQKIAIIGSPNSDGYTDFMHTIKSNQFDYKFSIDIYQSAVQGIEAANELINKLIAIFHSKINYDCVVIIRGGGAKTDFLVFDNYNLSRAVSKFPIPIITGIGHHKDVSIVDLMCHTSTKTPTKAAEFIISQNRFFEDNMLKLQREIVIKSQQLISNFRTKLNASNITIINKSRTFLSDYKEELNNINQIVINKSKTIIYSRQTNLVSLLNNLLSKPQIIISDKNSDLKNFANNLVIFSNKYLINRRGYLGHYESIVKLMSPKNILKKGFAIISQNGKILNNAESIFNGEELNILMESFEIKTKVISKTKKNE